MEKGIDAMKRNHKYMLVAIILLLATGVAILVSRSGRQYYKVSRSGTFVFL